MPALGEGVHTPFSTASSTTCIPSLHSFFLASVPDLLCCLSGFLLAASFRPCLERQAVHPVACSFPTCSWFQLSPAHPAFCWSSLATTCSENFWLSCLGAAVPFSPSSAIPTFLAAFSFSLSPSPRAQGLEARRGVIAEARWFPDPVSVQTWGWTCWS